MTSNPDREPRILEHRLDWADPERVYLAMVADSPTALWLDVGPIATKGISVIGIPSRLVSVQDPAKALPTLRTLLATTPRIRPRAEPTPLGWVGWIGYEVGSAELGTPAHRVATPAMLLGRLDRVIVFDHARRGIRLLAIDDDSGDSAATAHTATTPARATANPATGTATATATDQEK